MMDLWLFSGMKLRTKFDTIQSCAVGIGNALADSGEVSGSAGFITAVLMLVAGIISIAGRKSKGATITALVFYVLAGIIACTMYGSFSDLQISFQNGRSEKLS